MGIVGQGEDQKYAQSQSSCIVAYCFVFYYCIVLTYFCSLRGSGVGAVGQNKRLLGLRFLVAYFESDTVCSSSSAVGQLQMHLCVCFISLLSDISILHGDSSGDLPPLFRSRTGSEQAVIAQMCTDVETPPNKSERLAKSQCPFSSLPSRLSLSTISLLFYGDIYNEAMCPLGTGPRPTNSLHKAPQTAFGW